MTRSITQVSAPRTVTFLGWAAAGALLVSCTAAPEPQATPPDAIECAAKYRPQAGSDVGEESRTLVVPRIGGASGPEVLDFATMTLAARYIGDAPEGRSIDIVVEAANGTRLTSTLFQLDEDESQVSVEFVGGHGFTGLHYVQHDGAELQYTCAPVG
ncbi:hypothetical protein EXU48_03210 [Occultella glacieicola]|uniref:Lipoprotein n=1 Tax=Occultella glacieicola TaxID=2518684 RepID=A0ABY2E732_9MICO|nr:hypothetical protein [Occultella glacieicola]TDE97233.1 hypothetical protein EXU48_03210 [Occultella glacieicola]